MHERTSKSGLFLMELIIVILFFSLASAVTVQLFVKSHLISRKTVALTQATMITQNFAEVFRNSNGNFDSLISCFQSDISASSDDYFEINYSTEWCSLPESDDNGFQIKGYFSKNDCFHFLQLSVFDNKTNELVYEINIDQYTGSEVNP